MPEKKAEALQNLRALRPFLEALDEAGFEFTIIGGCAVGVYADQIGETVFSADLDVLVTESTMGQLLVWAKSQKAFTVSKNPQPRSVPVAVLYWGDLEINVLTGSAGLPNARRVTDLAREVDIEGVVAPIADPFDLLANKLAVRRDKDLPHIDILRRFVEAEIVETFSSEKNRRRRLAPARRYLELFGLDRLPDQLAEALLARASFDSDYRFLASATPDAVRPQMLQKAADSCPEMLPELEHIIAQQPP